MTGQFESHLNQVCKGQHYHNGGNHSQMNIYIMVKVKYLGVAKEGHFRGMWVINFETTTHGFLTTALVFSLEKSPLRSAFEITKNDFMWNALP